MALDPNYVYEGLLQYNYFPMVKEHRDDIPPLFSSEGLTPEIGNKLIAHYDTLTKKQQEHRDRNGFDQIEYRTTRFNNVLRLMHVPHPLPFARLCGGLRDHWAHLDYICANAQSKIKPERHGDGRIYVISEYEQADSGRVVIMEKERFPNELEEHLSLSLGASYYVDADVSGCFPSIYSHAIPWALVGHKTSKQNRKQSEWYNSLDFLQRHLKRNETQGVPVGPATSNIMNEIILARVDASLSDMGYRFRRYIDDYTCYCETRENAEKFIRDLERELGSYLLTLNARKVTIEPLPVPTKTTWVTELAGRLPPGKAASTREIVDTFDAAVHLQRAHQEGSVVKYAARALASKLQPDTAELYCKYLVQLAFHYPIVLPILCGVVKQHDVKIAAADIGAILRRQIEYRRSDMTCWALYLLSIADGLVPAQAAKGVVDSRDSMAMASLLAIKQHEGTVFDYVSSLDHGHDYELDKNWLLVHEMLVRGQRVKTEVTAYAESSGLAILVREGVSFLVEDAEAAP